MSILLYIYFSLLNISIMCGVFAIFFLLPYGIATLIIYGDELDTFKPLHKTVGKVYFVFLMFTLFLASIPDIKQMSMIFGIPAAMELSKNPDVQKIPQNILNIINQELEGKVKKHEDKKEDK